MDKYWEEGQAHMTSKCLPELIETIGLYWIAISMSVSSLRAPRPNRKNHASPHLRLGTLILVGALLASGAHAQPLSSSKEVRAGDGGGTTVQSWMGNPAAAHCKDMGYQYDIVGDDGQRGACTLPGGQVCDAWEFLKGKCGQSQSYCAKQGYRTRIARDGIDPFTAEYAVCVTGEGLPVGSVTELSNLTAKSSGCTGDSSSEQLPPVPDSGDSVPAPLSGDAPDSFDWRNHEGSDWMSPVRNQGSCGSCWAFAAVGVSEAAHNIANNQPDLDRDLSEQYLVSDCSSAGTCCGGVTYSALRYIRDFGIPDESCMSYADGSGCTCGGAGCSTDCTFNQGGSCSDRSCDDRCDDWSSRLQYIASTGHMATDRQTIKQTLVDMGPVAVNMGIGSSYGGYWDGDIYRCTNDVGVNHGVVLVGYDDAGGYWWVRNSWGASWGEGGYFKLGYGECHAEDYIFYADAGVPDVGPVAYVSYAIDDDASGESAGNGDGIAECGEAVELSLDILNSGSDTAMSVSAAASTSDAHVTWLGSASSNFPDIAAGATETSSDVYSFLLDPGTPDGHSIHFDLEIAASNGGPWTDSFQLPVICSPNNPPFTPSDPSPPGGATGVSTNASLSWSGGDPDPGDAVAYDVYLGTSEPPTTLICNDITSTTCDPGTPVYDTQYYWSVVATDSHGASTTGPSWEFTTEPEPNDPPYTPGGPSPADGFAGVLVTTALSWTGGDPDAGDAVTYDAYLETSDPPTTLICNDFSSTTCDPGTLEYGTQYYWSVVATDSHGASTTGPSWEFTTESQPDSLEPDDTWNQANPIVDGSPQTHSIVPADDVDWVEFSLSAESEIVVSTSATSGDTRIWLYDADLSELEYNDDGGGDLLGRIDRTCGVDALPAGTYYVKVDEFGNDDPIPSFDITFSIVAACQSHHTIYLPAILRGFP